MNIVEKPIIGFSVGDLNGIGPEIILKTLSDHRMLEICTPVVFGNNKLINFYRKTLPEHQLTFFNVKDEGKYNPKQMNLVSCWEEEVVINPGQLTNNAGKYAIKSLNAAVDALKKGFINGIVTAPIHKSNVQSEEFKYTGHTPFLKDFFGAKDVCMLMIAENMRVGLVTEHLPVKDVAQNICKEKILSKIDIIHQSLINDFGINKPKIAVLALNPHAGDEGLIGKEEQEIIIPAIKEAKQKNKLVFGPYAADAFFTRASYEQFDAVLAMYHDQGLIPFKSLAFGEGVNYTAGLNVVRTSPDHGTAFDISGKGIANESSLREAIFACVDIFNMRREIKDQNKNPIQKRSLKVLRNAVDEKLNADDN